MNLDPYFNLIIEHSRLVPECEIPVVALMLNSITLEYDIFYNEVYSKNDPTAHAEIQAIRALCSRNNTTRLTDYYMLVNLEPCVMCAQAISNARIKKLYFSAYDSKSGGVENGVKLFYQKSCHYKPEFYGGFKEEITANILHSYFEKIRDKL